MLKECSRCQGALDCKAKEENFSSCACFEIELDTATLEFLKKTHYNCLCNDCLIEVNDLVQLAQKETATQPGKRLVENLHYYMENGLLVFTEYYHLSRGYCCGSGCRHCAYGFKKDAPN